MKTLKRCQTLFLGWQRPLLHSTVDWLWNAHQTARSAAERTGGGRGVVDSPAMWSLDHQLMVLPTRRAGRRLHQLLRQRADQAGVLLVGQPAIITVGELPERLYSLSSRQAAESDEADPGQRDIADEIERTLAWATVLQQARPQSLAAVFSDMPAAETFAAWMELAATLRRLQEELASSDLTFADVAEELAADQPLEQQRWQTLQRWDDRYQQTLARAGRIDPHHARREAVQQQRCECDREVLLIGTSDLSESLTAMLRQLCQTGHGAEAGHGVKERPAVTALIAADPQYRDHFDPFGSIIASRWCQWQLPLTDQQLIPADDVTDQAAAAAAWVRQWRQQPPLASGQPLANEPTPTGELALTGGSAFVGGAAETLGVTHEELIAPLEFEMWQIGVPTYREVGWTLPQTPVGRLLELLTMHVAQRSWQSLAALVRHADVYDWIDRHFAAVLGDEWTELAVGSRRHWLTQCDELLANHYPARLSMALPDRARRDYPQAVAVADFVQSSLADFIATEPFADSDAERADGRAAKRAAAISERAAPISVWAQRLSDWLGGIYWPAEQAGQPSLDVSSLDVSSAGGNEAAVLPESPWLAGDVVGDVAAEAAGEAPGERAVRACRLSLRRLADLPAAFDVSVHAAAGLDVVVGRLFDQRVSDTADDAALTIAGWLDLALEDSPALVVLGLNHPYVPESVTADPFLPGDLRTRLQLSDNQRRLGRDTYALHLMLSTRQRVRLIVGRRGADGSPTPPSRLLAAAAPQDVACRVVGLLQADPLQQRQASEATLPRRWDPLQSKTQLPIAAIGDDFDWQRDLPVLSVTSFSAYRQCPYRFYLRHVLKLRPLDDSQRELAANQFGDLVHHALEAFGESADKDSDDEERVAAAMSDALDTFALDYYGSDPAAAVRLQIAQARKRLQAVARAQVAWRRQGWQIYRVEASVGERDRAAVMVDDQPMPIRGRFDRIDRHPELDRWAILDYKTHGHLPRKKHLKTVDGEVTWVDLQLPIYRRMIPFLLGTVVDPQTVELGYFNISDKADETKVNLADFTPEEFALADQQIQEVIRAIRGGQFAPTNDPVLYDDYAMILQSQVADQLFGEGGLDETETGHSGGEFAD